MDDHFIKDRESKPRCLAAPPKSVSMVHRAVCPKHRSAKGLLCTGKALCWDALVRCRGLWSAPALQLRLQHHITPGLLDRHESMPIKRTKKMLYHLKWHSKKGTCHASYSGQVILAVRSIPPTRAPNGSRPIEMRLAHETTSAISKCSYRREMQQRNHQPACTTSSMATRPEQHSRGDCRASLPSSDSSAPEGV